MSTGGQVEMVGRILLWIVGAVVALFVGMVLLGLAVATPETDAAFEAKRAVETQLKDSSSAEFRQVKVYKVGERSYAVCGEVNARNGFGAMAGFSRFVYLGQVAVIDDGTDETFNTVWSTAGCDDSKGFPSRSLSD